MTRGPLAPEQLAGALAKGKAGLMDAVRRGVRNSARRGRAHLVRVTPKDSGLLKASWKDTTTGPGATSTTVAMVYNDAPYAGIVEAGARPHPVSEEGQLAIYEWVKRHFGFQAIGSGKNRKIRAVSLDMQTANAPGEGRVRPKLGGKLGELNMSIELVRIAEAIIHKLRTKGQAPTYFVKNSLPDLESFLADEVSRAVERYNREASR